MKNCFVFLMLLVMTAFVSCAKNETKDVSSCDWLEIGGVKFSQRIGYTLENPVDLARTNEGIVLSVKDIRDISADFDTEGFVIADADGEIIASQVDDLDGDGRADEIAFTVDLGANEKKTIYLYIASKGQKVVIDHPKRVHARMGLKGKKNKYIPKTVLRSKSGNLWKEAAHHGPAWESELMAYRVYFDYKSAVDVYAKVIPQLELEKGQWYVPEELRKKENFGMDILHIKEKLGIGSVRGFEDGELGFIRDVDSRTGRIVADGPVRTIVDMKAAGWKWGERKADLTDRFIMYAGHRDTIHQVILENISGKAAGMCTGIMKIDGSVVNKDDSGILGVWGSVLPTPKSTEKETIGLGLVVGEKYFGGFAEDADNHIIKLNLDEDNRAVFLITAAWTGQQEGAKSSAEFIKSVKDLAKRNANPVVISTGKLYKK